MDQELAILRKQCVDSLCNSADYVLKYLDDKEKTNEINKLKTCVQNYCYLDKLSNLEKVKNFIDQNDDICNYEEFEGQVSQWGKKLKHNNHTYMKSFMDKIKSHQAASPRSEDPDIEIMQTIDTQIDPITKQPIRMPVKNKFCGHVYDMTSISEYMRMKNRAKCPYVGCLNMAPLDAKSLVSLDLPSQNDEEDCTDLAESQEYEESQDSSDYSS